MSASVKILSRVTLVSVAALLGASAASAAETVGIVVEITGKTTPPLAAFAEIDADETVSLAPGAKVKIVHYRSCRAVTVSGGSLKAGAADFALEGATVDADQKTSCPRKAAPRATRVAEAGTGGIVVRGVQSGEAGGPRKNASLIVGPSDNYVLAGERVTDVRSVRLVRDDKVIGEWQPTKGQSWAPPKDALKPGDTATLIFTMKSDKPPVEQPLTVLKDDPSTDPAITVIRLD